jgi:hypothetical protein
MTHSDDCALLSTTTPTADDLLADARVVGPLMSFVRTNWMPTPSTFAALMTIIGLLSTSPRVRQLIMNDAGYDRLCSRLSALVN